MTQPSGLKNMLRAAAGALPFVPRGTQLPDRTVTVDELPIDRTNVAEYAEVTGLRYGDTVPLTYPFALTFPSVMSLVSGFDFPFAAMGSVHVENEITQHRPIRVTDTVNIAVHAENLREHRKGLLVDVVTDVSVGNEVAWHQVTTFLHQQRTSLSDEPKPPQKKQPKLPAPKAILRISPGQIRRYAAVGGDHNPIHTSSVGAKLFGFPTVNSPRNVQRGSGIGQFGSQPSGSGDVFGAVRQAGAVAGHRRVVRRPGPRRLGPQPAQHFQGLSAPDRLAAGALAAALHQEPQAVGARGGRQENQ